MTVRMATALLLLAGSAQASQTIETVNGRYEVVVDSPAGKGPFPLLVIGPAIKLTMTAPMFERIAKGAAGLGYYAVRFNWHFITMKEEPSAHISDEARDFAAVVDHFRRLPEVDSSRVVLAAKSFGVKALMLGAQEEASALLLLTPNCDKEYTFRKAYKPIFSKERPVHIVISTMDPYCEIGQIYEAMRDLGPETTLHTLAGDHNFMVEGSHSTLQQDAAIQGAVSWLERRRK